MRPQFAVERSGRRVAGFRSDAAGRFEIRLAPGRYEVVPLPGASLLGTQRQAVEVQADGLTEVVLRFDTGIR